MPLFKLQMLTAIFDYLEFRENLDCSLVCKRWLNVMNNNTQFMRTVNLWPLEKDLKYLNKQTMKLTQRQKKLNRLYKMARTLTRDYRNLYLNQYIKFNILSDIKVSLLETAEKIWFTGCTFQDLMEFKKVVDCCQNAIEFDLFKVEFGNLKYIPKQKSKNKEDNAMVRPVKCTIILTDWRVLQCCDNIYELNVVQYGHVRKPSIEENLFLLENYAHKIASIDFNGWTNDELILLSKKGQLRSIQCSIHDEIFLKFVLDDMCQHLHNLETFYCTIRDLKHVNFNKLKNLTKLRSLSLDKIGDDIFELDITELTLTEVTLRKNNVHLKILKKFSQPPMTSMKKLQIINTQIEQQALNAIISLMPNLEYLSSYFEVSLHLFVSIFY
jgi:hypothetical protein